MSLTTTEINTQPDVWEQSLSQLDRARLLIAAAGQHMLVLGCGTSAFVAQSIAHLRESSGHGVTDAAYASEPYPWRDYDIVLAISRSGTTTEVIDALKSVPIGTKKVVVTGVADSPCALLADEVLLLDFADERSVVQTRFPTTLLFLARAAFGENVAWLPDAARRILTVNLPVTPPTWDQTVFLGRGWTNGLAMEAALKIREAAQAWAESYPILDYRHGPLAVAHEGTLVWMIGASDASLQGAIEATGATVVSRLAEDPLVELVLTQRLAVSAAVGRGLDPDRPRHLTRSIILA